MIGQKVKLNSFVQNWSPNKRYKISSNVRIGQNIYQNTTGVNSNPELLIDWIFVWSSSLIGLQEVTDIGATTNKKVNLNGGFDAVFLEGIGSNSIQVISDDGMLSSSMQSNGNGTSVDDDKVALSEFSADIIHESLSFNSPGHSKSIVKEMFIDDDDLLASSTKSTRENEAVFIDGAILVTSDCVRLSQGYRGFEKFLEVRNEGILINDSSVGSAYLKTTGLASDVILEMPHKSGTLALNNTNVRTVASSTTILLSDKTINISSGTFTQNLITAVGNIGLEFEFINSGSGIVTLDANSAETINGSLTLVLPSDTGVKIKSDNSNWIITSKFKQENLNRTQWSQNISTTTIANATSLNILTLIANASKVTNGTDGGINELNIVLNGILIPWHGVAMTHEIRVIYTIDTGSSQNYNMELRRVIDNSVIGTSQVNRNADTGIATAFFSTYTGSSTDPFVLNGFYIAFRNNSGASVDITTNLNLFITSYFR
jgi:hypothetical protein